MEVGSPKPRRGTRPRYRYLVPYRIDVPHPPDDALDQLVQLGALDVEPVDGGLAAILPDSVTPGAAAVALGRVRVRVSDAVGRDDDSVWLTIRAFSRPSSWIFWVGYPLVRLMQAIYTSRYERALSGPIEGEPA